MSEYIKFFKDSSIYIFFLIIVLIEIAMQFGCYKPFIKRNSYAANVNRITEHILDHQSELDPDILIVGTSLAYEGISVDILNARFSELGMSVQSVAIPGAELIVQSLAVDKVLKKFKNVKYIIHVNEAEMPWVDFSSLSDGTLAMISEFDRSIVYKEIYEHGYNVKYSDLAYIGVKLISYRKDIGDFILYPDKRIKGIGRIRREKLSSGKFPYLNEYKRSLAMYSFTNLEECIKDTGQFSSIPNNSDEIHRDAIHRTCLLAKNQNLTTEKSVLTDLYKIRLQHLYKKFNDRNLKIINVFPPLPRFLDHVDYPAKIQFWKTEYSDILSGRTINLYDSIPKEESPKYFYDLVHMNQEGNKYFSEKLASEVLNILRSEVNK
jgi:hypothetical protein